MSSTDAPAGPLAGRRVVVTRAAQQAAPLSQRIRALGGEPIEAPAIAIAPGDHAGLRAALERVAAGDFVALCLTSVNGVAAVADVLAETRRDGAATLTAVDTIACVGPGTAAVLQARLGIAPDLVPERATTAALAEAFAPGRGRVLLARADIATPALAEGLAAKGYDPVEVAAYRTARPQRLPDGFVERLRAGDVDIVTFGSASAARNFAALTAGVQWSVAVVSIGPVTTAACRELGIAVTEEASQHDLDGLVAAVVRAADGLA